MSSINPPMLNDKLIPAGQDSVDSSPLINRLAGRFWALVLAYPNLFLGILLSLAVCAPWLNGRRLLLLDWSTAQSAPLFPSQILGLHGGLVSGYPFGLLANLVVKLVGSFGSVVPIVVFFPVASVAIGRLIPGKKLGKIAGALLYCVNPFVYDRIYVGHLGLLLGYAFLPLAFSSLLTIASSDKRFSGLRLGIWWTVLIACSPHFLWIFGIPLGLFALLGLESWKSTRRVLVAIGFVVLTNLYIVIDARAGGIDQRIGINNLLAYRTLSDPHLGLLANVTGLYGFWRLGPALAKNLITGWPLVLFAILVVAGTGFYRAVRSQSSISNRTWTKRNLIFVLVCGALGVILAMGDQGPAGSAFRYAYIHVPFFAVMREPQKFLMLWAMVLALGFGIGVEELKQALKVGKLQRLVFVVILALPLIYQPLMFWGLSGQLKTSHYPKSWYSVRSMVKDRQGALLALPWHQYLAFPFTGQRVIANPASQFFGGNVIVGGDVELPNIFTTSTSQRQAYLDYILANGGGSTDIGALLEPLGVQYLVLFKTVDWKSYNWLTSQNDLSLLYNSGSIELFLNRDFKGMAYKSPGVTPVKSLKEVMALAQLHKLDNQTVVLNRIDAIATNKRASANDPPYSSAHYAPFRQTSSTQFEISPNSAGWVDVALPYDPGWKVGNISPVETASGTMAWYLTVGNVKGQFAPAFPSLIGDLFSLIAFLVGIATITLASVARPEVEKSEASS